MQHFCCLEAASRHTSLVGRLRAEIGSSDMTALVDADPALSVDCRSLHSSWVGWSALLDRSFKRVTPLPVCIWLVSMVRTALDVGSGSRVASCAIRMPALRLPVTGRHSWRCSFGYSSYDSAVVGLLSSLNVSLAACSELSRTSSRRGIPSGAYLATVYQLECSNNDPVHASDRFTGKFASQNSVKVWKSTTPVSSSSGKPAMTMLCFRLDMTPKVRWTIIDRQV